MGAYQTCIELLRSLFPDGEDELPRLTNELDQAWTLNALANAYRLSGPSHRAVSLFELISVNQKERGAKKGLANIQLDRAEYELKLGGLAAAEADLRKNVALTKEIGYEAGQAAGHLELGRVLAYEGQFDESHEHVTLGASVFDDLGAQSTNYVSVARACQALAALLAGNAKPALERARLARKLADQVAKEKYPFERDFVRAEWLIGAALVALATEGASQRDKRLAEAETHLSEALTRCRRINLVEIEADILLSWARWHRANGHGPEALEQAGEALAIADRCEYRLNQAEIHNFLATLALEDDHQVAIEHATIGYERAWCDGPPHAYEPALDEAKRLLDELGVEPPEMPAYAG